MSMSRPESAEGGLPRARGQECWGVLAPGASGWELPCWWGSLWVNVGSQMHVQVMSMGWTNPYTSTWGWSRAGGVLLLSSEFTEQLSDLHLSCFSLVCAHTCQGSLTCMSPHGGGGVGVSFSGAGWVDDA